MQVALKTIICLLLKTVTTVLLQLCCSYYILLIKRPFQDQLCKDLADLIHLTVHHACVLFEVILLHLKTFSCKKASNCN